MGAIRDALIKADPAGEPATTRRAAAYVAQAAGASTPTIARCIDRVPPAKRKLVTTHDALGYFADRYGIEVIGAVIPSLSTQAQPSAKDVDELVDQIEREGVEAIFPEASLTQKLEQAISARRARGRRPSSGPTRSGRRAPARPPTSTRSAPTRARSPRACRAARVSCELGG